MGWLGVVYATALVGAPILFVVTLRRQHGRFDELIAPPDDLRRADDGFDHPGLAERDGTGGFL